MSTAFRSRFATVVAAWLLAATLGSTGCTADKEESTSSAASPPAASTKVEPAAPDIDGDEPLPPMPFETALPESVRAGIEKPFKGDLEEMVERRLVRVGVAYNRTLYFVDKGVQRGVAYEYVKLMEDELNKRRNTGNLKVNFWFVPLPRDRLLPALVDGKVDMVIGQITVTPDRQALVDFTNPTRTGVDEVVVTGPGAPPLASLDDLAGREVFVRRSSSYHQSLLELNERLQAAGKPAVVVRAAPENLEDEDLLEMVDAGLIEATIVDDYLADLWKQVYGNLTVHDALAVRTGGNLAVAIRKDSPQLAAGLNGIIEGYGRGTLFGNMMEKRYFKSTKYLKNPTSEAERKRFLEIVDLFRKYGEQYELDYLLMAAQGFQESGLDHAVRSPVGAIGVMQVMPATGKELQVGDIAQLEPNIHAGVKYIRFVMDEFFKDEPMTPLDKGLFAFASYNAGPGRIRQLRREAARRGLDPNVWFGNVEQIASERIGRETVTYVGNIYKYYVAYRLVVEEQERRASARKDLAAEGDRPAP